MIQKRNLSTEKIIEAAKEIINKEGAEKLSFSKVAGVFCFVFIAENEMRVYFTAFENVRHEAGQISIDQLFKN